MKQEYFDQLRSSILLIESIITYLINCFSAQSLVLLMVSVSVILLCAASTLLLEMVEKRVLFSSPKAVLVLSSQVQKAERVWYSTYIGEWPALLFILPICVIK